MLGFSRHGELIRFLQEDAAELRRQVTALTDLSTSFLSELASERDRLAAEAGRVSRLEDRLAELEGVLSEQSTIIDTQARTLQCQNRALAEQVSATEMLREEAEQQAERIRQSRADLTRLERQAAIDLDEMRETSSAVAATVLLKAPLSVAVDHTPLHQ